MNIKIEQISGVNKAIALKLKVAESQKGFCESVQECLRDAEYYCQYEAVIIFDGDEPIGFCMYGFFKNEGKSGRAWLDRFFIDERFQGKGYGKKSVVYMIDYLRNKYKTGSIYLSVYEDNLPAIKLYESLGFIFNGEKDFNGEDVMVLSS